MTPIPEQAALYAAERAPECGEHVVLQRAYMAGALAALTSKAQREQLLRECIDYGRAIGTAAEAARTMPTS
ncbi:MAG: hypothetical protein IT500_17190 [Rubrivivax sp.]|nr:hypothetical protein [Rubrivivax sp.]